MTEQRDPELENWLGALRAPEPTEFEMRRWKKTIVTESQKKPIWKKWSADLLKVSAAAGIGYVVGQGALTSAPVAETPPTFLRATQPEDLIKGVTSEGATKFRFVPDAVSPGKARELAGQPLVTRSASLFDTDGSLWAFDLKSDGQFVAFETRKGIVALSFSKFKGSQPLGVASGSKITVKGAGTQQLILQSQGAIVPEGVDAVVHARVLPLTKAADLTSISVFESAQKANFEEQLQQHDRH